MKSSQNMNNKDQKREHTWRAEGAHKGSYVRS